MPYASILLASLLPFAFVLGCGIPGTLADAKLPSSNRSEDFAAPSLEALPSDHEYSTWEQHQAKASAPICDGPTQKRDDAALKELNDALGAVGSVACDKDKVTVTLHGKPYAVDQVVGGVMPAPKSGGGRGYTLAAISSATKDCIYVYRSTDYAPEDDNGIIVASFKPYVANDIEYMFVGAQPSGYSSLYTLYIRPKGGGKDVLALRMPHSSGGLDVTVSSVKIWIGAKRVSLQ